MFRQRTILALLLLATASLAACAPAGSPQAPSSDSIPFTTLAQGAPLGDQPAQPLYTAATQPSQWQELTDRLPAEASQAGMTAIESNQILILAFAGVRSSSGYRVTVERIVPERDRLVVTVSETEPDPDQVVEPATTLPYHLVALSLEDVNIAAISTIVFQNREGTILNRENL